MRENLIQDCSSNIYFSGHFYNASIHNYASLNINNYAEISANTWSKNALYGPCAWNVAYQVIFHVRTNATAARIHKTTIRNVSWQRTHPTPPARPMEEETMANAFRKPIGPSAGAYRDWNCRRNENKDQTLACDVGGESIDRSMEGFIAPRGLFKIFSN